MIKVIKLISFASIMLISLIQSMENTNQITIQDKIKIPDQILNLQTSDGNTLLHSVCMGTQLANVKHLIQNGAFDQIKSKNSVGMTPLHLACLWSIPEVVEELILWGACPKVADNVGRTALHFAIARGDLNIPIFEIIHKAFDAMDNNEQITTLHKTKISDKILNLQVAGGSPLLHYACMGDRLVSVKYLINNGALDYIESKDSAGMTPLHQACLYSTPEVVEELLLWGASPEVADNVGRTALHFALVRRDLNVPILEMLQKALAARKELKEQGIELENLH